MLRNFKDNLIFLMAPKSTLNLYCASRYQVINAPIKTVQMSLLQGDKRYIYDYG